MVLRLSESNQMDLLCYYLRSNFDNIIDAINDENRELLFDLVVEIFNSEFGEDQCVHTGILAQSVVEALLPEED